MTFEDVELLKSQNIYSKCAPSSVSSIGIIVNELLQSLQNSYGYVSDCTLFELRVILNEILTNAVRHGNGEDENKFVKVDVSISGDGLMNIVVEDEGSGYNFCNMCGSSKPFSGKNDSLEMSESGRGIMIVKGLCDSIKVNEKGNKIIIAKSVAKL